MNDFSDGSHSIATALDMTVYLEDGVGWMQTRSEYPFDLSLEFRCVVARRPHVCTVGFRFVEQ